MGRNLSGEHKDTLQVPDRADKPATLSIILYQLLKGSSHRAIPSLKTILSTERRARPAQRYRASQQLDLVINRHFFRLHYLTFNLVHRQPGIA